MCVCVCMRLYVCVRNSCLHVSSTVFALTVVMRLIKPLDATNTFVRLNLMDVCS